MSRPAACEVPATDSTERYFAEVYDHFVNRLVTSFRCSREDAEDAMQFAFMKLIRHKPCGEKIEGWLWTVAKHEVLRTFRGPSIEPIDVEETAGQIDPELTVDAGSGGDILRLVSQLKSQQGTCLIMQAPGFSYAEIGEQTGQTYTWVNRHLTEGRRALRQLVRDAEAA